jgi:hypothetical protein
MKIAEIALIKSKLELMSKENLTFAYEIAKNLRICNKYLDEGFSIVKELQLQFVDRDEKGEIKVYKDEKDQDIYRITDPIKFPQYQEAVRKLEDEDHNPQFVTINKSKIEAGHFSDEALLPLIDVIIIE